MHVMIGSSLAVLTMLACGSDSSPTTPTGANPFVIAYTAISDTDCRIVIATLGGRIDSLPQTTCGDDAAWSPDGHRIAFEKLQGGDVNPSSRLASLPTLALALFACNSDSVAEPPAGRAKPCFSGLGARALIAE
jgi:dipeptidyl aminopeptidase/acylaminoacyl peptidase